MIISFSSTNGAMIAFCVHAPLLKLLASVVGVMLLLTGYCIVQLSSFLLSATPVQFLRIVLFTLLVSGGVFIVRFLLNRKQVRA
jgi:hypothetical protein